LFLAPHSRPRQMSDNFFLSKTWKYLTRISGKIATKPKVKENVFHLINVSNVLSISQIMKKYLRLS